MKGYQGRTESEDTILKWRGLAVIISIKWSNTALTNDGMASLVVSPEGRAPFMLHEVAKILSRGSSQKNSGQSE